MWKKFKPIEQLKMKIWIFNDIIKLISLIFNFDQLIFFINYKIQVFIINKFECNYFAKLPPSLELRVIDAIIIIMDNKLFLFLNKISFNICKNSDSVMELRKNMNSDSISSWKKMLWLTKSMQEKSTSKLDTTCSQPWQIMRPKWEMDSNIQHHKKSQLSSILQTSLIQLTGELKEQSIQLKIKLNADHAGHSQPLLLSKELTSLKLENFFLLLNNNSLIVILHHMDVMEDGNQTHSFTLKATLKILRINMYTQPLPKFVKNKNSKEKLMFWTTNKFQPTPPPNLWLLLLNNQLQSQSKLIKQFSNNITLVF